MVYLGSMGAGLLLFWLLLSGHYTTLLISFGVASVALVLYIAHRMDVADHESVPLQLRLSAITYVPWLTLEVLKANVHVLRVILTPRLPIRPTMGRYLGHEKTAVGRFIYANSITLTPGTITTGVYGNTMEIHALTKAAMDGTEEGEMDRRVCALEPSD
jgi:multicomponent Na+:H+ antiporter subunit E